jgi:hypothetical protein
VEEEEEELARPLRRGLLYMLLLMRSCASMVLWGFE